jgi:uncharacterized protein YndB with AHSA1/START domain
MFKKIALRTALVLVVLIAAVLIFAATRPDAFRVERTISIKAPPEKIFPLINDFHNWVSWSPYEKLDPNLKRTYSGPAAGEGAVYEWEGDGNVGKGRMEITDAPAPSRVAIQLDFIEPMEAHNAAEFTLEPQGDTTNVTWAMHGPSHYMMKVMDLFIGMDNMVGPQFEEGLANLKAVAEKPAADQPAEPESEPMP